MTFKGVTAAILVAGFAAVGAIAAAPAMAATVEYKSWTESDDPTPGHVGHDLVFFKAASVNYGHTSGTALEHLVKLADVDGLAYTVKTSTSYAPSYQIDIVNDTTKITYARLVWEPYMQSPAQGERTGTYTNLEDGLWWGNNVWQDGKKVSPSLFVDGGSQSDPKPLTYFQKIFGDEAQVDFFGLKQGSTTESTSTVTSLTFEGNNVPLDSVDSTPYNSKDIDAEVAKATAPLTAKLADSQKDLADSQNDLADLQKEFNAYKASHPLTTAGANEGFVNTPDAAKAKWKLVDMSSLVATQNAEAIAKAKIVSISGTEKAGKTVTAKSEVMSGASHSYAWYVGGKLIKSAKKSTLKLTRNNAHHALSVLITTSWTDANGSKRSVIAKAKYLRTAYISR